jgi:hypothetical protein
MKSSTVLGSFLTTFALVACSTPKPPSSMNNDVPPLDGFSFADTNGDSNVLSDAALDQLGPGMDVTSEMPLGTDVVRTDVQIDRPPPSPLCTFSRDQFAAFAIRMGLCTFTSPQAALNRYFRPDTWEGGAVETRPCPALQGVATATGGTCNGWFADYLKYTVTRATPMTTCPSAGCDGTSARACVDGIETRNNCQSTGLRCVASSSEAACVPMGTATNSCMAGDPPRCNGTVFERCVLNTYSPARDCARSNGVCDTASPEGCRGSGASCTEGATSCNGTFFQVCRGGRWHSQDCGRVVPEAVCQTVGGHSFCGTATDCDPTVAPPYGTCDANTLVLCSGGRSYRYVCDMRNGFTSCMDGAGCIP